MTTYTEILRQAVNDPGSIVPRGDNFEEPLGHWQARAVIEILQVTHGVDPDGVYAGTPASNALMEHATLRGKLEAAEHARDMAQRELRNVRQQVKRAHELLHEAWGVIANAENFKHELICEHEHCIDPGNHLYTTWRNQPIGPLEWRQAANTWRDGFHAAVGIQTEADSQVAARRPRRATPEEIAEALDGGPMKEEVFYPEVRLPGEAGATS
jgi:hypothetical protein